MRVVIHQDWLRSGGTERQALWLAGILARAGHQATLLTNRPGGRLHPGKPADFALRSLQPFDTRLDWFAPGLRRTLRDIAPDVVIAYGRTSHWHLPAVRKTLPSARLFATLRTGRPIPWWFQKALRTADHVIANSRAAASSAVRNGFVTQERVSVIHNALLFPGSAPASAAPPPGKQEGRLILLQVGMFRHNKGQEQLIEICAGLPGSLPWELWLAGDGHTLPRCRRRARALGVADRVRFTGWVADPRPLYGLADIAVLASARESLSNFLCEAQWHGLPAVACDMAGVSECFRDGASGILIPPVIGPDPAAGVAAFRSALVRLAGTPLLRAEFSENAQAHARESFAPENVAAAHLALLQRCE